MCLGFILAEAEKNIRGGGRGRKNSGGAESSPKDVNFFSAPPLKKFCLTGRIRFCHTGAKQTREGQKEKEGEISNNRE